jgi:hypothetical protein
LELSMQLGCCLNDMLRGTYLTRSNMETRLPTGERRHVPSGVKSRFPLL